jgi:hypothetical protein
LLVLTPYHERLDNEALAMEDDPLVKDSKPAITLEKTFTLSKSPLRKSKRKAQEVDDKKDEKKEQAKSLTLMAKKVMESLAKKLKTNPKSVKKAMPKPALKVAIKPVPKKTRTSRKPREKKDCDGICGIIKD